MSLPYVPFHAESSDVDDMQTRQYQLLELLQDLVQKLPINLQQRLPYSLLSDIAAALLDRAIFTIVGDLQEIQHLTEKNLYAQRQKLMQDHKGLKQELRIKHKEAMQTCRPHNIELTKSQHDKEKKELEKRLQDELQQMDMRLLQELDEKVSSQQLTMQSAGMPGFFVTSDPKEIKLQMAIFQLVTDVSNTS